MTTSGSSQSERVDLREVWPHEGYNFTPWLAENLHLLGEAIGMKLSLIQEEASGWSGYLDILAEAIGKGKVAIENQIEPSDNDHFARLLGYAAEHDACELVWVAPQFWEYHLRQIAWLNKVMAGNAEIHAVAVRLEPGGDLRPVGNDETTPGSHAKFVRVDLDESGPEWAILRAGELSETDQRRLDFFQRLLRDLRSAHFTDQTTARTSGGLSFPSDLPGISYNADFGGDSAWVYLWISAGSHAKSTAIHDGLLRYNAEIARRIEGVQFDFIGERFRGWRRVSLGVFRQSSPTTPDEQSKELREWIAKSLIDLKEVCKPYLKAVLSELQAQDGSR